MIVFAQTKSIMNNHLLNAIPVYQEDSPTAALFFNQNQHIEHQNQIYREGVFRTKDRRNVSYTAYKVLGSGSFGVVYAAITSDNVKVAVKSKLRTNDERLQIANELFRDELEALFNLEHPNLLRFLGTEFVHNDVESLVMEFIEGETLEKIVQRTSGRLPENLIQLYTKQIVLGMSYMHSMGVMHRDLKSANVMIIDHTFVKIIDFGLVKPLFREPMMMMTPVGTIPYMAPEVYYQAGYSFKADVYSIGVILFEMAQGLPFLKFEDHIVLLLQANEPIVASYLSPVANDFMQKCLIRNPNFRTSALQSLHHAFLSHVILP